MPDPSASGEIRVDERGPIFDALPSGLDIMHWFIDKRLAREWVGCGGDADYILWRDLDAGSGGHVDLLAIVDHDDRWYWLLDVGTYIEHEPTTCDLLFVGHDLDGKRRCEWRNKPSTEQADQWGYEGLVWFASQIESFEGRAAW